MSLSLVVEGDTDLPVARRLAADAGLPVSLELDQGGKDALDAALPGFANAAKGSPWFVLRDLDRDADCPVGFLRTRKVPSATWLCFRLAVRSAEAWMLADHEGLAPFLGVAASRLPQDPDAIDSPKRHLVDLAQRGKSRVRKGMVPRPGGSRPTGPLYESLLIEFGTHHWELERAAARSESLRRARAALRALGERWRAFERGGHGA
jgi:hypothetical protein